MSTSEREILDQVINTFGSAHFDPKVVREKLLEDYNKEREEGQYFNGSLLAVANIIENISDLAKQIY